MRNTLPSYLSTSPLPSHSHQPQSVNRNLKEQYSVRRAAAQFRCDVWFDVCSLVYVLERLRRLRERYSAPAVIAEMEESLETAAYEEDLLQLAQSPKHLKLQENKIPCSWSWLIRRWKHRWGKKGIRDIRHKPTRPRKPLQQPLLHPQDHPSNPSEHGYSI